jgi:phosphatidylserine/phosphatidylglycerophosphate/cardiolipin synthase-like enzyme
MVLVGSGNWDTRSLRLNFEFNLECYCPELAKSLDAIVQSKLQGARQVTQEEVDGRSTQSNCATASRACCRRSCEVFLQTW